MLRIVPDCGRPRLDAPPGGLNLPRAAPLLLARLAEAGRPPGGTAELGRRGGLRDTFPGRAEEEEEEPPPRGGAADLGRSATCISGVSTIWFVGAEWPKIPAAGRLSRRTLRCIRGFFPAGWWWWIGDEEKSV